jgi:hypothetical protein
MTDRLWRIESQEFPFDEFSLIVTLRHPNNPALSWTFLHISPIEISQSIVRKLPHYGRYGYLAFKGADNVLKGEWQVNSSPLSWNRKAN